MSANRISHWLRQSHFGTLELVEHGAEPQSLGPQLVSVQNLYQLAAAQAYREHQLDRLFNAEYYGDHGSGI